MSSPAGSWTPPETSETATTVAPRSTSSCAAIPPTLPKPCTTQRCSASFQPSRSQARAIDHHDPRPGRLVAEDRAADRDRLARHDLRDGVAALHRVRVHHPRHRLLVRRHVRRRDVLLRADERQQLRGEAAREALELARRELARVAADAALRAAVRQAQERALPRHPHGERGALAERDLGVVADAALRRAEHARVLHAVAGEDDAAAVVEPDRAADDDRPLGMPQPLGDAGVDVGVRNRLVELGDRRAVERCVVLEVGERRDVLGARHRGVSVALHWFAKRDSAEAESRGLIPALRRGTPLKASASPPQPRSTTPRCGQPVQASASPPHCTRLRQRMVMIARCSTSRAAGTGSRTTRSTRSCCRARSAGSRRSHPAARVNLAPFSFFNAVAYTPPQVMFATTAAHREGGHKDSVRNALATGEFVVNLATHGCARRST